MLKNFRFQAKATAGNPDKPDKPDEPAPHKPHKMAKLPTDKPGQFVIIFTMIGGSGEWALLVAGEHFDMPIGSLPFDPEDQMTYSQRTRSYHVCINDSQDCDDGFELPEFYIFGRMREGITAYL